MGEGTVWNMGECMHACCNGTLSTQIPAHKLPTSAVLNPARERGWCIVLGEWREWVGGLTMTSLDEISFARSLFPFTSRLCSTLAPPYWRASERLCSLPSLLYSDRCCCLEVRASPPVYRFGFIYFILRHTQRRVGGGAGV